MDSSWQLRYQQLEQARNSSDPSLQEQLNILERALKIVKRDIVFITASKFFASCSCLGMLFMGLTELPGPTNGNQTLTVQDITEVRSQMDFISFRRVISVALVIYAAKSLWNGWCQLKFHKKFMEELNRSKKPNL